MDPRFLLSVLFSKIGSQNSKPGARKRDNEAADLLEQLAQRSSEGTVGYRVRLDDANRLQAIVFQTTTMAVVTQRYNDVCIIDFTYKTNRCVTRRTK